MKIGYSFWGFIGDGIVDTPDGGRFWRRTIIDELRTRGHDVVLLQRDRDNTEASTALPYVWDLGFPPLDVLFCEWRWPMPGRNTTDCSAPGHTCDLHRQADLLSHYTRARRTPTVLWDTDRQIPATEPLRELSHVLVCDPGLRPSPPAPVLTTMIPDALIDVADPGRLASAKRPLALAYVGNQYDRDEAFGAFFAPAAAHVRHRVAGKWTRTTSWPHVNFTGRCAFSEVGGIYRTALATVLLLPERYATTGAISQRLGESVLAGCLPLTPATLACAEDLTPELLHVEDSEQILKRLAWLRAIQGSTEHADLIADCLTHLEPLRHSRQIDALEQYMTTLVS
ncbi:hypothetical protein AB0M44_11255 [Streptosporangium subroseum]|uniref:hypothetical protein n=1 Tax=Streptosporangium subroseum TaxID=106412 RepID=UPI0034375104